MRIGIVCPYSFDVPGGVQIHVRDLAEHLIGRGHHVSVLAPADDDTPVPPYVVAAGKAMPVKYNGSVARLTFGPMSAARTRRWLGEGDFDVLHIHEPISPSLSLLALWSATGPIIATCHTSVTRSRAMQAAQPILRPSVEKISARIAVSEDARRTVVEHLGGDAVVIPNGVYVDRYAGVAPNPQWQGSAQAPTFAFVGRLDEPRKGLPVLAKAIPDVLQRFPQARFLVLGRGDASDALRGLGEARANVELLGALSDEDKASLLRSVDVYVAPHTGGESFGIVLVEAMSAGAPVVASNLGAFRRVLGDGEFGALVPTGDSQALAKTLIAVMEDEPGRRERAQAAGKAVRRYDWETVADEVLAVYETVRFGADHVRADPKPRGRLNSARAMAARTVPARWRGKTDTSQTESEQQLMKGSAHG